MDESTIDNVCHWDTASDVIEDCIFILDKDMIVINANQSMRSFFGKENKELIGKHCWELVHGTTAPPDLCPMDKMLKSKKREFATIELTGKFYKITVDPILDEHGSIKGAIHILRDIDESERKSRLVEESAKKYHNLVETMSDVTFTLDFDGNVIEITPSIHKILGLSREDILGRQFSEFVHPDDIQKAESEFLRAIQGVGHPIEIKVFAFDDTIRWVRINALLIMRNSEPENLLCVLSDITEAKKNELLLLDERNTFQKYLAVIDAIVIALDNKGNVTLINNKGCEILHAKETDIIGKNWFTNFIPQASREAVSAVFRSIICGNSENTEYFENEVLTTTGAKRLIAWHNSVIRDEVGKIITSISYGNDITEKKELELELKRKQEILSNVENVAKIGGFEFDVETLNQTWTEGTFRILEIDSKGGEPKVPDGIQFIAPEYRAMGEKAIQLAIELGQPYDQEWEIITTRGNRRWVRTKGNPNRIDGKIKSISGSFQDITDLKLAEEKVIEKSSELAVRNRISEVFLKSSDDEMFSMVLSILLEVTKSKYGVFGYIDQNGDLIVPTMAQMGWDKCQIPNKTHAFSRETWGDSSWPTAIRQKRTIVMNEPSETTPMGDIRITRHISMPLINKGEVIGLIQVADKDSDYSERDISQLEIFGKAIAPVIDARIKKERKEEELKIYWANLERMVAARTSELKLSNEELESFVYSVSHDLRAPLRSIDGFSQAVMEDYADKLDAKGQDYLSLIRDSTQRMGHLIDEMLMLSRISRAELKLDPVNLSVIAEKISKELKEGEPSRKVDFIIEPQIEVNGDRDLLRILMENLIWNAWKFTSKHESARIEIGRENGIEGASFYVKDDGAGFDMKYVDKLFIPFQRLHSVSEFPGTGVGLATIRRILNKHGGEIWAEGAVEKGAIFHFTVGSEERISAKANK